MASSAPPPFLASVQYLRALAALMVVAFHAGSSTGLEFNAGAFGVHLFFVISGFIMVAITGADTRAWPFLKARLWRIAPPYWVATIAALLVYAATIGGRPPAAEIAASFLFLPWGEPGLDARYFPVLDVGWTLNYEMFFYAVFAGTLLLPCRLRLPALTAAFAALLVLRPSSLPFTFWAQPIILEFLAGAWLGAYWKKGGTLLPVMIVLGVAFIALPRAAVPQALPTLLFATFLVAAALALERGRKWPLLLFLGEASYSIYLWHLFGVRLVPVDGLPGFLLATISGVAAGIAAYFLIERPLRRLVRARREGPAGERSPNS